jgi:hypothetical protein
MSRTFRLLLALSSSESATHKNVQKVESLAAKNTMGNKIKWKTEFTELYCHIPCYSNDCAKYT